MGLVGNEDVWVGDGLSVGVTRGEGAGVGVGDGPGVDVATGEGAKVCFEVSDG